METIRLKVAIVSVDGPVSFSLAELESGHEVSFKRIKKPQMVNEVQFPYLEPRAYAIHIREEKDNTLLQTFQVDITNP